MTAPSRTPNPATATQPGRSSKRVARKAPLGWLPWALLAALLLLLLLTYLVVHAVGPETPAGTGSDPGSANAPAATGTTALAGLSRQALVGGGSVPAGPAASTPGAQALASAPGVAGTVLFAESSAAIDPAGQQAISAAATSLRTAGAKAVEVVGHTDVVAGAPVNNNLSQQRADAVAAALRAQLPGVQVTTSARSQNEPIASNDTEQGRQLNRRAVITARG